MGRTCLIPLLRLFAGFVPCSLARAVVLLEEEVRWDFVVLSLAVQVVAGAFGGGRWRGGKMGCGLLFA